MPKIQLNLMQTRPQRPHPGKPGHPLVQLELRDLGAQLGLGELEAQVEVEAPGSVASVGELNGLDVRLLDVVDPRKVVHWCVQVVQVVVALEPQPP